jgi:hypothetical protein
LKLPFAGFAPDQPPEAWQDSALLTDHVRVEEPLSGTKAGLAANDTPGVEGAALVEALSSPPPLAPQPASNPARSR